VFLWREADTLKLLDVLQERSNLSAVFLTLQDAASTLRFCRRCLAGADLFLTLSSL
jgi:hypothetical protein